MVAEHGHTTLPPTWQAYKPVADKRPGSSEHGLTTILPTGQANKPGNDNRPGLQRRQLSRMGQRSWQQIWRRGSRLGSGAGTRSDSGAGTRSDSGAAADLARADTELTAARQGLATQEDRTTNTLMEEEL